MSGQPAARLHDPIAHTNAHARFWAKFAGGLIGGIAVGFAAGVAVAAVVGTGGLAGPLVAGAVVVGARMAGGYVGASLGESIADALVPETLTVTGAITSASSDVFVNSKAVGAARASPDIPMDTVSCSRDSPQILLAEGAETVFINRGVASRKDDHTECGAKVSEGSPNVFIGGPTARVREVADEVPLISKVLVTVFNVVMIYRGLRCLPKLARQGRQALPCLIEGAVGVGLGIHGLVSSFGNPVHAATGAKFLGGEGELDFSLPGPLPIAWQRFYNSRDLRHDGPLGQGWNLPYSMLLRLGQGHDGQRMLTLVDRQGRELPLPDIPAGSRRHDPCEGVELCRTESGHYFIHVPGGLFYIFEAPPADAPTGCTLRLARLEDRNGNFIALSHDASGRLAEIVDGTGRRIVLEHEERTGAARLCAVHLAAGARGETPGLLVAYRHDAEGRLAEVRDRAGAATRRFGYDGQGLMRFHADAAGLECHYEWTGVNAEARVRRHWTSDGRRYEASYAPPRAGQAFGETRVVDNLGRVLLWQWNDAHQLVSHTNAQGQRWQARYDELGLLATLTEPDGATMRCDYDAQGFPCSRTDALGRTWRTGWTDFGLPWHETLPDGSAWTYAYSDEGNLVRETDPLGHVTEYAYDRRGLPVRVTDPHGGSQKLRWNERAQLAAFTDCSGSTTRYDYDGWGYLAAVTDALGQRTLLAHDARGRLLSVSRPDGSHQGFERDAAGRLVAATDALSRRTHFVLGSRGEPMLRRDAEGRQIAWHYDAAGRLQRLVNENGRAFEFVRDQADRIVEERRVDGTRVQTEHDANGRVVAVTHWPGIGDEDLSLDPAAQPRRIARPLRTELVRDAAGRLLEKRTASHRYRYRYDLLDRLVEALKLEVVEGEGASATLRPLHRTCLAYDRLGRIVSEIAIDERSGERHALHHEHDAFGNRTRTVLPALDGAGGASGADDGRRVLDYLHYGSGHLHRIDFSHESAGEPARRRVVCDIERDALHREVARSQGALSLRFALDPLGRRSASWCRPGALAGAFSTADEDWRRAMDSVGTADARVLDGLMKEYRHDAVGELRGSRHSIEGATGYRYDATGRVEERVRIVGAAQQPDRADRGDRHERFGYDPAGNLLDAAATFAPPQLRDNLVRVSGAHRYVYDGHGRLVCKKSGRHTEQRFDWDDENRLAAVHTTRRPHTPEAISQTTRFDYDALGRRVAKRDAFGHTRFVWEGMRLIEERRGGQAVAYVYEPGSYVPLARLEASQPGTGASHSERIRHFHTDTAGRPEELSDEQGRLCWRASYRTWGATVSEHWELATLDGRPALSATPRDDDSPRIEQNLRLQGQYLDRDTGLHYNTFRYYDPDIGRFIGPDPIGLAGGMNLHAYAPNPIAWIDPWGLNTLEKGSPLPDAAKVYRVSTDGPFNFDFNARELDAIGKGKLNPPGVSVIRANSADEAMGIWNKAFPNRPAASVGEIGAADLRATGFDVIHDPSKGALGQNHARLIHPEGVDGFNANKGKLLSAFKGCAG
ncbi:RHS repeat-associated core domain-containing protein [Variovorax sp. Varisp41]|uniref:RHS repeat-associated core domain-containing protein n=1 Tax=Variovorax sp. Varisp41 TaxID=3243033 RepID=UPI0039B60C42